MVEERRVPEPLDPREVTMAKRHSRPSAHYRYEHYDPNSI